MITPDEIHPEAWRRADLHKARKRQRPHEARIGQVSYQCKKGDHRLKCTKLNCPCECHAEERELMASDTRRDT